MRNDELVHLSSAMFITPFNMSQTSAYTGFLFKCHNMVSMRLDDDGDRGQKVSYQFPSMIIVSNPHSCL